MPDFSKPEYASYITLCQELKLEHEWRSGDWFCDPISEHRYVYARGSDDFVNPDDFWLPQLADWLDMLEAGGIPAVTIVHHSGVGEPGFYAEDAWSESFERSDFIGQTREEALARLTIAVGAVGAVTSVGSPSTSPAEPDA